VTASRRTLAVSLVLLGPALCLSNVATGQIGADAKESFVQSVRTKCESHRPHGRERGAPAATDCACEAELAVEYADDLAERGESDRLLNAVAFGRWKTASQRATECNPEAARRAAEMRAELERKAKRFPEDVRAECVGSHLNRKNFDCDCLANQAKGYLAAGNPPNVSGLMFEVSQAGSCPGPTPE